VDEASLTGEALAEAIRRASGITGVQELPFSLDGAERSAEIVAGMLDGRG